MKFERCALLCLLLTACDVGPDEATRCEEAPLTERREHTYDADGRLVQTTVFRGGERPDHVWHYSWDGDRLVRRRVVVDDVTRLQAERTYDDQGRMVAEVRAVDGAEWRVDWAYDAEGRPVESVKRGAAEAIIVDAERYAKPLDFEPAQDPLAAFAPEGLRIDLWVATPADGELERLVVTYRGADDPEPEAPAGAKLFIRRLRTGDVRRDDWDTDFNGHFDLRVLTRTDAAGAVVEERLLRLVGETEVPLMETTFDGHVRVETSYGEGGRVTRVIRTEYDERGERILREEDREGDGDVDWRKVYEYDESGRRRSETRDRDGDGDADQVWTYTYDGAIVVREDKLEARPDHEFCDD